MVCSILLYRIIARGGPQALALLGDLLHDYVGINVSINTNKCHYSYHYYHH